jgi:SAM-dependent methyltransferase
MDSEMWDARYETKELVWGAEPNRFLPPLVEGIDPGSALDLACGEGRNAIWLARRGWDVTGVDFSARAIDKARLLAEDTEVDWVVCDVTRFVPDRLYDLVMIFYLHLPEAQLASTFEHAIAALAPGGAFFGIGHALRNLDEGHGGPPAPEILWTEERIAPLVRGLDVVEIGERLRPVEEADATAIDFAVHAEKPR